MNKPTPYLRAENLQRCFIDGERRLDVLKGASLSLFGGEVVALVGRSGSGKSTLLHLLGLLDRPDGGEILIDETPTGILSEKQRSFLRNRKIGFVFQHYFLLPEFNVLENVLMPAKVACSPAAWPAERKRYQEQAEQLIEWTGLGSQMRQRPLTLSGGERQRVAVARALLLSPKILFCDEPTGNLDPETGCHIMDLIFELSRKRGSAVLLVTHDSSLSARADRSFRLERGLLTAEK